MPKMKQIRRPLMGMAALLLLSVMLAGCAGAPAPLVSAKYLEETSLASGQPCSAPCFQGITLGETKFDEALKLVKENTLFTELQSQDSPPAAVWKAAKGGENCCQLTADPDSKIVNSIVVRLASPGIDVAALIAKQGDPAYVVPLSQEVSATETALGMVYPAVGLVAWAMPGDAASTLDATDPVVVAIYVDPKEMETFLASVPLQGWAGYKTYNEYRSATPIVTPRITVTPSN
jgi:hypothetical protein